MNTALAVPFLGFLLSMPLGAQMEKSAKIYVAGHRGLAGSAIVRKLQSEGYNNLVTRTSAELDLRNQAAVEVFFASEKPEFVFLAAAKVGGILANNNYRGQFIYENMVIEANVVHAAYRHGVKKLLFLGSSCIYPRDTTQPIVEEALLSGPLEQTNLPYAVAKIAGITLCQSYNHQYGTNFISVMPTNLYGPNDNYDLDNSHVFAALLRKIYEAKQDGKNDVVIWGTGEPYREFLHADDLASAVVFLMNTYSGSQIFNIGTGTDVTIKQLAFMMKDAIGFKGELVFDVSKPDGTPRKLLDVSRLNSLGWSASIPLQQGIAQTLEWAIEHNSFEDRRRAQ